MGVIQTSKIKLSWLLTLSKSQEKWKSKKKELKVADSKLKKNQQACEEASGSKKKKFEKKLCPYCEKGCHLKISV